MIYAFWNTPAVQKAVQTLVMVGIVTIVALLVGGVGYLIYSRKKEKEMVEKGYVKYVNADGKEVWGTPEEAERMSYYNQVVEAIREFKPARGYQNERYYQYELYQWLKAKFKDVRLEEQRGSSRPDIVVGDIAIEVKGPTGYQDLQSIADKLVRYPEHFSHVIVVLFDVTANPARYDDWKRGLKKRFPEVSVIRKDSIER